ncbi:MAG: ABC transporter substrate-binding protein [Acidimicrobiales bacterium]
MSKSRQGGPRQLRLLIVALVAAVSILSAACGSSSSGNAQAAGAGAGGQDAGSSEGTPVDGGSLVVGVANDATGWNPVLSQWADTGSLVGSSVLEPLATIGPDKGAKPWLAESWIANEKFDSWVVHIRPNVKFQNGEALTADVVKQNLDFYVHGALTKLALEPMINDVQVVDPLSVQVNLKQPWGAFPSSFLVETSYMMAPAMLGSADQGLSHPIGTGPFTFDSWQTGTSFKAKKNPNYWQAGLPHLDSIEFRVIPDETSRVAALTSGDVNMILTTTAADATQLATTDTVVKDWSTENDFIMTNTSPQISGKVNPLANPHARKALALATDRQAVARLIGEGVEIPTSPWSPSSPWGMPDDQNGYVDFNLDAAKAEVAAYVQDTGASKLSFTLLGQPGIDEVRLMQLLQSQWKDAGIEMNIETVEQSGFITRAVLGDFQAAMTKNYSFADPDLNYSFWSSTTAKGNGNLSINFTQYTTPEMEANLNTGRESGYVDVRKKAYNELVPQLNAGFTNIWLYRTPYSLIADPQVKGLAKAREVSFANTEPKTWLGDLWRTQS